MAKSSRGRRAAAERLGLNDRQEPEPEIIIRRSNQGRGASPGSARPAAGGSAPQRQPKPRQPRARRGKLPSDTTLAGAMIKKIFLWTLRLIGTFIIGSIALTIIYRFVDPPITPLMIIRSLEGLGNGKMVGIDKEWVDIDEVSPALLRSVIAAEDGRFFTHEGIDWKAVDQARKRNERAKGKKLYGASTISMQCARNVFLWQGRNYIRKGLEVYFTYLMEFFWSKKRILEVYVNVIEWGDGVYGVEAASQRYFGVSARELSPRQAALLAVVLPNPRVWNPGEPTRYIGRRARTIQGGAAGVGLGALNGEAPAAEKKKPAKKKKARE